LIALLLAAGMTEFIVYMTLSIYHSTEERRRDSIVRCLARFEILFMHRAAFLIQSHHRCLLKFTKSLERKAENSS